MRPIQRPTKVSFPYSTPLEWWYPPKYALPPRIPVQCPKYTTLLPALKTSSMGNLHCVIHYSALCIPPYSTIKLQLSPPILMLLTCPTPQSTRLRLTSRVRTQKRGFHNLFREL